MPRLKTALPVIAGAIAGAVVATIIALAATSGGKTVTDVVTSGGTVPTAYSKAGSANVNAIYKQDINGVVDIVVTSVSSGSTNGFFSSPSTESEAEGAGVVYNDQGDIITDEHVVTGASKIVVNFEDGYSTSAKIVGTDASSDVAVIKVNAPASQLHPIAFANSSDAQVGDSVVAIGSPFGLPGTVTAGIVSAVARDITAPNGYTIPGAIQTDAAINPGNSGGPLLDAAGQVLGLNDQIETDNTTGSGEGSSSGVGFATPGNTDVKIANEMIGGKTVQHAYVGVCLNPSTGGAQIATTAEAAESDCPNGAVAPGSPAAKAGLVAGDTITAVGGKKITSSDDFISVISGDSPGQTVTMTVKTSSGTKQFKVTLTNRPKTTENEG